MMFGNQGDVTGSWLALLPYSRMVRVRSWPWSLPVWSKHVLRASLCYFTLHVRQIGSSKLVVMKIVVFRQQFSKDKLLSNENWNKLQQPCDPECKPSGTRRWMDGWME